MEEIRWEMPSPKKSTKETKPISTIELKLNDKNILCEDAKEFVDYLSESIVTKNNKAIMKRSIYMQTLHVFYKLGLVLIVVKFFPEILSVLIELRGINQ